MFNADKAFKVLMDRAIGEDTIAGANIMVIRDGEEKFFGSYGMADRENRVPMKRDAVFRLFSMTKPVTAAAVMILVERGMLDLLDPVERYLPGFANQTVCEGDVLVRANRSVLIRDLMNMTSGVSYPGTSDASCIEVDKTLQSWIPRLRNHEEPGTVDFCNALGRCPLAFQPGERWMYGFSADILGAVVEVVSGMRFGEFLKKEIFDPLGMHETGFAPTPDMRRRMAQVYEEDRETHRLKVFTGMNLGLGDYPYSPLFESGGAGLLSTIDDYAKFAMMLAGGGTYNGVRILGENTVRFMGSNQLDEKQMACLDWDSLKGYGYGNLMRVLMSQKEWSTTAPVGEFGWDGWLGTYFIVEPKNHTVILYFIQKTDAGCSDTTRKVRAIAYSLLA